MGGAMEGEVRHTADTQNFSRWQMDRRASHKSSTQAKCRLTVLSAGYLDGINTSSFVQIYYDICRS